jgi:hypothetical protein
MDRLHAGSKRVKGRTSSRKENFFLESDRFG